jgi:hypothetical protein
MPMRVLMIDFLGVVLAVIGFHMAFRQALVRRTWRRLRPSAGKRESECAPNEDPVRYMLLISGVMVMIFGITIAGMTTLYNAASARIP